MYYSSHPPRKDLSIVFPKDALEYFQYLLDQVERCHTSNPQDDPSSSFKFVVEERILCSASGKVKYNKRADNVLSLNIPLQSAINKGKC